MGVGAGVVQGRPVDGNGGEWGERSRRQGVVKVGEDQRNATLPDGGDER